MNDQAQEIAKLRNEIDTLKTAFGASLVMLHSTHQLAMSLAATHPDGNSVADAFENFSLRGRSSLLHSMASDADLEMAEKLSAGISKFLRSPD